MSALGRKDILIVLLLTIAGATLLFTNLGNHYLWQDEAQTALLGRSVLEHGLPYGFDGVNSFSQEFGAEFGEDYIWKWHTWLPFYLVAASFKLFGESTLAARLPFALFGLGTVLLTYLASLSIWRNRGLAAAAVGFLLLCIPFLLLSRQCRYYSPAAFFSLLCLYAYWKMRAGRGIHDLLFALGAYALFHVHFVYTATIFITVIAHQCFERLRIVKRLALNIMAVGLACLPWIVYFSTTNYGLASPDNPVSSKLAFATYILLIFKEIIPYSILFALPFIFLYKGFKEDVKKHVPGIRTTDDSTSALVLLIINVFATSATLSLATSYVFFRYLAPIIPPLTILLAHVFILTLSLNRLVGTCVFSTILWFQPLDDYLYEISHDYDGPIEGIVRHLQEHASASDTVLITYGDLPIKFYTNLKTFGGRTGEDIHRASKANWVIPRSYPVCNADRIMKRDILSLVEFEDYELVRIDYPEAMYDNRESPENHRFRTSLNDSRVILYKKRKYGI